MSAQEPSLPIIDWQVRDHADQLKSLRHWRGNTDMKVVTLEGDVKVLHHELQELRTSIDRMSRRMAQFTFTLAAGSLTFAFTVLAATGRI